PPRRPRQGHRSPLCLRRPRRTRSQTPDQLRRSVLIWLNGSVQPAFSCHMVQQVSGHRGRFGVRSMKKFRLGVYALLALVVSTTAAFAVPGVIKSDTTLHAGPSLDSAVIGTLSANQQVEIGQCGGGLCPVTANGQSGWVSDRI